MIEHGCLKIGYAQFYRYVNRTNIYLSINISDNPRRYIPFFISIIIDILKKISLSPILSHIIPYYSTGLYDARRISYNPRHHILGYARSLGLEKSLGSMDINPWLTHQKKTLRSEQVSLTHGSLTCVKILTIWLPSLLTLLKKPCCLFIPQDSWLKKGIPQRIWRMVQKIRIVGCCVATAGLRVCKAKPEGPRVRVRRGSHGVPEHGWWEFHNAMEHGYHILSDTDPSPNIKRPSQKTWYFGDQNDIFWDHWIPGGSQHYGPDL